MRFWEIKEDILNGLMKFKVSLLLRLNTPDHFHREDRSINKDKFLS